MCVCVISEHLSSIGGWPLVLMQGLGNHVNQLTMVYILGEGRSGCNDGSLTGIAVDQQMFPTSKGPKLVHMDL